VGGAEQVLSALDEALAAAGHRSVVVACQGSSIAGELVPTPAAPSGTIGDAERRGAQAATRKAMEDVLRREAVDVVHMHGLDFAACLPPPGPPVLATLHLPPSWYPREAFMPSRPDTWLQCVSMAQHASCPRGPGLLLPIANGVDVESLSGAAHAKRGFALMLARICPEKGVHLALEAAHAADVSLLIGGEVFPYPEHEAYFAELVQPRLDHRRRFLGPLGFARKRRLLTAARCLLVPSLAPETSSLVAMEALACGTPVIAFRAGALTEIVEHERTGFLVRDAGDMAAAIGRAETIDPVACRAAARTRFSRARMADAYLARYTALAARAAA
jgi:glycosyltransferase involved in cell wall biosynthesis